MVFWHSLHYPTRRHHCQEYQRISSQTTNEMLDTFYGSLCSANCIDAHYFSMWNPFFLLSINLFQTVKLCRPERFGSVVQSSQCGASEQQRGLRKSPP
jgi:hypothetical protein